MFTLLYMFINIVFYRFSYKYNANLKHCGRKCHKCKLETI